ncbi:RRP15-like protein isoform X2 [Neltuma alba]|uniref:RRP15-like protein isoform X2 n=1 Tax=Neltuma alba TaxID=207710 RepID=UPI0010A448B2|nr:RRP15-like protein isoform X2 [Prosopis alba]XP_028769493.1 RRP15-like protein isoform X2 [Prosopis alba]
MVAEPLRDLSQPIEVPLVDATVAAFCGTGSKKESMAEETQLLESGRSLKKRQLLKRHGHKKSNKRPKLIPAPQVQKKVKMDKKMKRLIRKRAREYNSDDDDEDGSGIQPGITNNVTEEEDKEDDEGEDGDIQPGITKFTEGCRAFRMAFRNIMKKSVSEDSLGPVLSGHKKLIADKLAEEEAERHVKGEAKKEKKMLAEKGHVKPANYLDSHEKFLISVATKGVVKLFNAVNKAQTAQKGLNPLRSKDAKEIRKRTKEAFFSELGKPLSATGTSGKAQTSKEKLEVEEPAWVPLRDNYMLTSSRLKDWDKVPEKVASDDFGKISEDSSSDED